MIKKTILLAGIFILVVVVGIGVYWLARPTSVDHSPSVEVTPTSNPTGFTTADGSRPLSFPADFGPHPDYQTEWWYYTGNLDAEDGRHFGYQLTIFRRGLTPPDRQAVRQSDWGTNQVYMAHLAVTDVAGKSFHSYERFERGAAGLAGAQSAPTFKVWLDSWSVAQSADKTYLLSASQDGFTLDLQLKDLKGPVLEGDQGYSRKGSQPGEASYYFSQSRLETHGSLTAGGQKLSVSGLSWMDHEFSTSLLGSSLAGWDWFALQLSDGSELMLYDLRQRDGSADPSSSGNWIGPDGRTQLIHRGDLEIAVEDHWKSGFSQANYPSRWQIKVPSLGLDLEIFPYIADQEHHLSIVYWEGAVHFSGMNHGKPVMGSGYVELTGYGGSLGGLY
ncbi:MAG TPA: lipocalin-like domain-containing protein [Anaerolineaceae bacterium]